MAIIDEIATAMQTVLTTVAEQAARASGFVQRHATFDGPAFVQTLVFRYLSDPDATTDDLAQTAATLGITITGSGILQRCTRAAAACLHQVLEQAVQQVIAADPTAVPLLQRFTGVSVQDSTTIVLPPALADLWQGCGGSTADGDAALKLQIQFNLCTGTRAGLELQHGRDSDRQSRLRNAAIMPGALYLADLGFFKLARFRAIGDAAAYWLSRLSATVKVTDADGHRYDEVTDLLEQQVHGQMVDIPITVGVQEPRACRLVAVRAPQEVGDQRRRRLRTMARTNRKPVGARRRALCAWTVCITNVLADHLSVTEILTLGRVRWQIELLIRLWKSHGKVDESRSQQPYRILCAVYAKLLAMVIQQWVCLVALWAYPDRSLVKAARTIKRRALELASNFSRCARLMETITSMGATISGCRINPRKQHPNT